MTRLIPTLLAYLLVATASVAATPAVADAKAPPAAPTGTPRPSTDTRAAEKAARAWLALVDGGKYAESWTEAAALFRQAVPQEQWSQQAAAVRTPLGKLVKRELRAAYPRTSLPGAPDGEYVVLQFDTSFEHKQAAVETVTPMREPDGSWRVSGYFVR